MTERAEAAGIPPDGRRDGRSDLYALLSRSFAFPAPEFHREVIEGRWLESASSLLATLPYRLQPGAAGAWGGPSDYDRFQSEFIRLFEVGARGSAPCALYGGHYARDRLRTMEELVRFYNFFGLRLSPGLMPDHITVELEFMHYLAFKETEAGRSGDDVESYLRAQKDFLDRHLGSWLPALQAAMRAQRPLPFYRALVRLAARFVECDRRYLGRPDGPGRLGDGNHD